MKILITQLGCIGDLVLMTSVIPVIKKNYPDAVIDFIAGTRNHKVLDNNPNIRKVLIFEKAPLKITKFFFKLLADKYDYYIDPKDHYSHTGYMLAYFVKATTKVGFVHPDKNKQFDIAIPSFENNKSLHFVDRCLNVLEMTGIKSDSSLHLPQLFINEDSQNYAEEFFADKPQKPLLLLNFSAGNKERKWNKNNWLELLNNIDRKEYLSVMIFTKDDTADVEYIQQNTEALYLFHTRSINDVIYITSRAELVITPDTSVLHICSAFDKPIIALRGGYKDNNTKFAPLSRIKIEIEDPLEYAGVEHIKPELVIEAFNRIVKEMDNR